MAQNLDIRLQYMMSKLEDPERLSELAPADTLKKIGLKSGDVFLDVGAGTGIFTMLAFQITGNTVYAVDTSEHMRTIIKSKTNDRHIIVEESLKFVPDACSDMALLCTVLHEVSDMPDMLSEIWRTLKPNGRLCVIDYYKDETLIGPPHEIRLSEADVEALAEGFALTDSWKMSENLYCLIFQKEPSR